MYCSMMKHKKKPVLFILVFSGIILLIFLLMQPYEVWHFRTDIAMLFPKGFVALRERNLLLVIQIVMLLVVIPVYILTFVFSWKYHAGNKGARYSPDMKDSAHAELIWWGVPCLLIIIIGAMTWVRSYELDPFRPIASKEKTLKVQVVALQWKWLFIYPEEKIATVNFIQIPVNHPVHFEITSDAPMNSFWIPRLGSQIYAMPRMKTQLHLVADKEGDFPGSSANLSGVGFSGMTFTVRSGSDEDYQKWVKEAQQSGESLDWKKYQKLAEPSQNDPVRSYVLKDEKLFEQVLMKFMHPQKE